MTQEPNKEEPIKLKVGMILVDNPEAKEVYLYIVAMDENNHAVSTLGVPAKTAFDYLTQFQDKFMPKKELDKTLRDMVRWPKSFHESLYTPLLLYQVLIEMTELHIKGTVEKVNNVNAYNEEGVAMLGKMIKEMLGTGTFRITKMEEAVGKKVHDVLVIEAQ